LKQISKGHILNMGAAEYAITEKNVWKTLSHRPSPFIIRLFKTFQDTQFVYYAMEVAEMEFREYLDEKKKISNPDDARFFAGNLILALEHMHGLGIIYRDMKPENTLINDKGFLKLCDFSFGKAIGETGTCATFCGTPEYLAPEVVKFQYPWEEDIDYGYAIDWWACGVCIYEMICGRTPWYHPKRNDNTDTFERIMKHHENIQYPSKYFSSDCKDFLRSFIRRDPEKRWSHRTTALLRQHRWFKDANFDWEALEAQKMRPPFVPPKRRLKPFKISQVMNGSIYAKMSREEQEIFTGFENFDE